MKTSVVLSTYNGSRYIIEQLKSLRDQARQPDEVLVFDDGSTDDTVALVDQFIKMNNLSNWQLIINQQNKGWRRNFMDGMWQSHGDLVFPCDQDDVWLPDKIATMCRVMDEHPQIQLLFSNYLNLFDNGKTVPGSWGDSHEVDQVPLKKNYMSVDAPGCVYCIRRDLLTLAKKYWRASFGHDTLLWRMAELSHRLYVIRQPLIKWRKHRDSSFSKEALLLKSRSEKINWLKSSLEFNELMAAFASDEGLPGIDDLIGQTEAWLLLRLKFYQTGNFIYGIRLIRHWPIYPRYRQLLGDWYVVLCRR